MDIKVVYIMKNFKELYLWFIINRWLVYWLYIPVGSESSLKKTSDEKDLAGEEFEASAYKG